MKSNLLKYLFLAVVFCSFANAAHAQKPRKSTKRSTKTKTKANIQATEATADTTAPVVAAPVEEEPVAVPKKTIIKKKVVASAK